MALKFSVGALAGKVLRSVRRAQVACVVSRRTSAKRVGSCWIVWIILTGRRLQIRCLAAVTTASINGRKSCRMVLFGNPVHGDQKVAHRIVKIPPAAVMQTPPEEDDTPPVLTNRPELTVRQRQVAIYGERARLAYQRNCRNYVARLRGVDSFNGASKDNPAWELVGELVLSQGWLSPEQFIAAQFTTGTIPQIKKLVSGDSCKRYTAYADDILLKLAAEWSTASMQFRSACRDTATTFPTYPNARIWRRTLMDFSYTISPLFRYCVAASEGFTEEAEKLYESALQQLLSEPDGYVSAWHGKIPGALLAAVAATINITL